MHIITLKGKPATRNQIAEAVTKDFPALASAITLTVDSSAPDGQTFIAAGSELRARKAYCDLTGGYTWSERVKGIEVQKVS